MKNRGARVLCIVWIALILTARPSNSVAQILPSDPPTTGDRPQSNVPANPGILARNLMGSRVQSTRGDELGFVSDLLIDPHSGGLDYVVITSGGFLKFGRKLRPVPPKLFSTATAMRGVVEVDISLESWKTAPSFAHGALADLGDDASGRQLYAYYHLKWPGSALRADGRSASKSHRHSGDPDRLEFSSYFLGKPLLDRNGRNIARITDILLDPRSPQITFAIMRFGTMPPVSPEHPLGQQFAVPVNDLAETTAGERRLTVAVASVDFQQALPLKAKDWTKTSSPTSPMIYKFHSDQLSDDDTPASTSTRQ
jgi:sporulation protein YlmC with PRC-barrel domain